MAWTPDPDPNYMAHVYVYNGSNWNTESDHPWALAMFRFRSTLDCFPLFHLAVPTVILYICPVARCIYSAVCWLLQCMLVPSFLLQCGVESQVASSPTCFGNKASCCGIQQEHLATRKPSQQEVVFCVHTVYSMFFVVLFFIMEYFILFDFQMLDLRGVNQILLEHAAVTSGLLVFLYLENCPDW